jgi:hypothetical protein
MNVATQKPDTGRRKRKLKYVQIICYASDYLHFFHGGNPKIIFLSPPYENENKTKRQLLTYGNYSSIVNCRAKILAIFPGIFGISRGIPKFVLIILLLPADPWLGNTALGHTSNIIYVTEWCSV